MDMDEAVDEPLQVVEGVVHAFSVCPRNDGRFLQSLVKWFLRNGGCCLQTVGGVVEEAVDEGLEASMIDVVNGEPLFSYSS